MSSNPRILVFRFSALGDVAMTIPLLWSLRKQYPEGKILLVSRPFAHDLVEPLDGIEFFPVSFQKEHQGFGGLLKLFRQLKALGPWDFVADLHGVLRTHILGVLFRFSGVKCATIDKGRQEKKALTRRHNKVMKPLQRTIERYLDVFQKSGCFVELLPMPGKMIYARDQEVPHHAMLFPGKKIGIAPFAKHPWKEWPEQKMRTLLSKLDDSGMQIFLFGGRGEEQKKLDHWASSLPNAHNLAGILTMAKELKVMASLDVMVSMDSANMHLASLVQTPVVSLWGATHPFAGFYGWQQLPDNAVQVDLPCRPCSVFGNKACYRGDFACMNSLSVDRVLDKIFANLK